MANPQTEDGFTKIANEIMDALCRYRIPGEERQVLDVIFRKTYGWNKRSDNISLTQFAEATGISKPHVVRAIQSLLSKKVIVVTKKGNDPTHVYEFNKDYESWKPLPKKVTLPKKAISVAKKGNEALPNLGTTKDTITKDTITKEKIFSSSGDEAKTDEPFYATKKGRKLTGKRLETFLRFWEAFDYKSGKAEAAQVWFDMPQLTNGVVDKIMEAARREAANRPTIIAEGRTPKMAQGWLSGRRWEDEPLVVKSAFDLARERARNAAKEETEDGSESIH